jgi:uncharacterized protein
MSSAASSPRVAQRRRPGPIEPCRARWRLLSAGRSVKSWTSFEATDSELMSSVAYIDSSALVKLVVREKETSALEADLANRDGLVASRLVVLECRRAARRTPHEALVQTMDDVLEAIYLLDVTPAILDAAATAGPPSLRSLDAIHLATALSIGEPGFEVITYDDRLADASRAAGLTVVQPGR